MDLEEVNANSAQLCGSAPSALIFIPRHALSEDQAIRVGTRRSKRKGAETQGRRGVGDARRMFRLRTLNLFQNTPYLKINSFKRFIGIAAVDLEEVNAKVQRRKDAEERRGRMFGPRNSAALRLRDSALNLFQDTPYPKIKRFKRFETELRQWASKK